MPSPARRFVPLAAVAWLCAAGCKRDEEIRSYDVARETPPSRANPHADMPPRMQGGMPAAASGPQRLLVAWIPSGARYNLFVKLSAPVDAVAPHPDAFKAVVASLRYTGDDRNPAVFAAPAGWQLNPKPVQFRAATLTPVGGNPTGKPPEITISTPIGGTVLENVNRWRDQIGLPPTDEAGLAKDIAALPAAAGEAKFLDLSGPGVPAGTPPMRGPFQPPAK